MKTMIIAILGAIKVVLEAFGIQVLDEGLINDLANGVAAVVVIVGIFLDNRARRQKKLEAKQATV